MSDPVDIRKRLEEIRFETIALVKKQYRTPEEFARVAELNEEFINLLDELITSQRKSDGTDKI